MKRTHMLLALLAMIALPSLSMAQKFAYVDTDYIMNKIPTYKSAQDQIDKLSEQYQKEVEDRYAQVEKMYNNYQTEKVLLTEDMRRKKEDEIIKKEREVKELQMNYFGPEGQIYKKREELVKPIQEQVYNAIKEIAAEGGYAIIFDAAGGASMVYTNSRYDKSDEVLQKLGYK